MGGDTEIITISTGGREKRRGLFLELPPQAHL